MELIVNKSSGIIGDIKVPGDKSISHRAAMLLSLCGGRAIVKNFLFSDDCMHTVKALRLMGSKIAVEKESLVISGDGRKGLIPPHGSLYMGNSGTSMRLISGICASLEGCSFLFGDDSLNMRPMGRIVTPLREMGAEINSLNNDGKPPLVIRGRKLKGIEYKMDVASAQVKSCILIAGLFAEGYISLQEKSKSRDHTERMLEFLGVKLSIRGNIISMECGQTLSAKDITVPGDISSAAFLLSAAAIIPGSNLTIRGVSMNETRSGFIDIVKMMGADVRIFNLDMVNNEEIGDINIKYSDLKGVTVSGGIIPRLIDEIPVIAVMAAFAEGDTYIRDAEELKHKESNRLKSIITNLRQAGIEVDELEDGMVIHGQKHLTPKEIIFDSFGDHRIAMAFSLFGLINGGVRILNCGNISTSFPGYEELVNKVGGDIKKC